MRFKTIHLSWTISGEEQIHYVLQLLTCTPILSSMA